MEPPDRNNRGPKLLAILAAVIVLLATVGVAVKAVYDPDIYLLVSTGGAAGEVAGRANGRAEWIVRRETPVNLGAFAAGYTQTIFKTAFTNDVPIKNATIGIRAMRDAEVYLDGRLIAPYRGEFKEWKETRIVPLAGELPPGKHELLVKVMNKDGTLALLAFSDALGIHTGRGGQWETSIDGQRWRQAENASDPISADITSKFKPVGEAFTSSLKYLLPAFTALFVLAYNFGAVIKRFPFIAVIGPSRLRWLLMAAWIVLAGNNIYKLPMNLGYDSKGHYEYIIYMYEQWRIPFADQGWQMFQPPLYYFLSACLIPALEYIVKRDDVLTMLRIVPYACVLVQIEVCYRAMRHSFASRPEIQILGLVVGGLLPMNLYMGQFVGNEPLAGALSSVFVIMSFGFFDGVRPHATDGVRRFDAVAEPQLDAVAEPQLDAVAGPQLDAVAAPPSALLGASMGGRSKRYMAVAGAVLGLALLTKITPIVLIPPLALTLAYAAAVGRGFKKGRLSDAVAAPQLDAVAAPQLDTVAAPPPALTGFVSSATVVAATAFIVAGWYYALVWIKFGKPFIGGWDPSRGISWWQNPAYRTPADFSRFGRSLTHPIYGVLDGLWDSLYSTFWLDGSLSGITDFGSRPPWNYDLMFASLPFTVILTAGIIAGIISILSAPWRNINNGRLLSVMYILFHVAAVSYLFLILPVYSTAKATYMSGITPCFAIAFAAGLELIANRRILYSSAAAVVSCWAIVNYLSYFVIGR
jgi:hypothetical protein